jgi:hypothetical protein
MALEPVMLGISVCDGFLGKADFGTEFNVQDGMMLRRV